MMFKMKKPNRFSYEPRYKKGKDGLEKERKRIEFRRITRRKTGGKSLFWLFLLLIIVVILINYLSKISRG